MRYHFCLAILLAFVVPTASGNAQQKIENPSQNKPLSELLRDLDNESLRYNAMWAIQERGSSGFPAIPALIRILVNDPSEAWRRYAAVSLNRLKPDKFDPNANFLLAWRAGIVVPACIKALRQESSDDMRCYALYAFGSLPPRPTAAVPMLLKLRNTKDVSLSLRMYLASMLGYVAEPETSIPALADMLRVNTDKDRVVLVTSGMPPPETLYEYLIMGLSSETINAAIARPAVQREFLRALADQNPRVRGGVAEGLGQIAHQINVHGRLALADASKGVYWRDSFYGGLWTGADYSRYQVVRPHFIRYRTMRRWLLPALAPMLRDPDRFVRAKVALAFESGVEDGDTRFLPALLAAAEDADGEVRYHAIMAVRKIRSEEETIASLLADLKDRSAWMRAVAAGSLSGSSLTETLAEDPENAKAVIAALIVALRDPDDWVQSRAVWSLRYHAPLAKAAVPALLERWKKTDKQARWEVGEALMDIDREAAKKAGIK